MGIRALLFGDKFPPIDCNLAITVKSRANVASLLSHKNFIRDEDFIVIQASGTRVKNLNLIVQDVKQAFPQNALAMTCGSKRIDEITAGIDHRLDELWVAWERSTATADGLVWTWDRSWTEGKMANFQSRIARAGFGAGVVITSAPLLKADLQQYQWDYRRFAAELSNSDTPGRMWLQTQTAGDEDPDAEKFAMKAGKLAIQYEGYPMDFLGMEISFIDGAAHEATAAHAYRCIKAAKAKGVNNFLIFGADIPTTGRLLRRLRRR